MVVFMSATGFASDINWDNFNSSLIIEVTRPTGVFTCSGVAINTNTVLTAAHCLEGEILKIRVSNASSYNPKGKFWIASEFVIHPEYNKAVSNFKSDLAKIKLKTHLPESTTIFPIIKKNQDISGNILRLGFGGRSNQNIRTLVTPELRGISPHQDILELDDMYSFSGDSGGPVFVQRNGQMYLVAIHSTLSYGPEGKYSFNPLLAAHREWINN